MRINSAIAIAAVLSMFRLAALAEDFPFYITDDGHAFQEMTNGGRFIRPQKIREAMKAKESRPAELDPDGNWGPVAFGSQVSLRSPKSEFSTNEPILATLIVRNVSDQQVEFGFRRPDEATCIVVAGPSGTALDRTDISKHPDSRIAALNASHAKGQAYWLNPGIQRKFESDLSSHWDLSTPGRYVIFAQPGVIDPNTRHFASVQSGKAAITVATTASAVTNAPEPNPRK